MPSAPVPSPTFTTHAPRCLVLAACAISTLVGCGADDAAPAIDADTTDTAQIDTALPIDADTIDALTIDASIDGQPVTFTLTSTAIVEGGVIPVVHSCRGINISPPLAWTGGPTAPGYALIFNDITSPTPFLHSIIWDIPGTATSLPENIQKVAEPPVPPGSKQPFGYNGTTRGYLGPCPGSMHRYEFAIHAVDTYPLPGVTLQSSRFVVEDAILAHSTGSATLRATFTP